MAGTITHEWIGTTLVITSDSGTSSCDLKGEKGDMGIRGPQGAPGSVYDTLNDQVKEEIAHMVIELLPDAEEVAY